MFGRVVNLFIIKKVTINTVFRIVDGDAVAL